MKLFLIDVSTPASPKLAASYKVADSSSDATYDPLAFRFTADKKLIIPVSKSTEYSEVFAVYDITKDSITLLFEVPISTSNGYSCWYEASVPARSFVFQQSELTTIKGHNVITTNLQNGEKISELDLDVGLDYSVCDPMAYYGYHYGFGYGYSDEADTDGNENRTLGHAYSIDVVQSDLDAHRKIWSNFVGEANNYDMTYEKSCFCPEEWRGPFRLQVRNGQVETATYTSESLRSTTVDPDVLTSLPTVEGIFDNIQNGLDSLYYEIRVQYNETAGYPISAYTDWDQMIADDEFTYMLSDVELVAV
jgi:hypothetical protein